MNSIKKSIKEIFLSIKDKLKKEVKKETPYFISEKLINLMFFRRYETDPRHYFNERWFKDLHFQREVFSNKSVILTGYYFHSGNISKDRIIIFAPGYKRGCHYYLDFIHYFTRFGYLVFSYDNMATDESDGKGTKGFPQALIDLESAIEFVKKDRNCKDEEIILMGHDIGGYAVGCLAKDHKNIKHIVMLSAYNSGSDLLKMKGHDWIEEDIKPYIKYIDRAMEKSFPMYSRYTVSKSMRYSHSNFLVIQSNNDELVPMSVGINLYRKKLPNWKRINYIVIKGRSHNDLYYSSEGSNYHNQVIQKYNKKVALTSRSKLLPTNIQTLSNVIDKDTYCDMLDKKLMECIITFIEK